LEKPKKMATAEKAKHQEMAPRKSSSWLAERESNIFLTKNVDAMKNSKKYVEKGK